MEKNLNNPQPLLKKYIDEIIEESTQWKAVYVTGGSDPFWSDGSNLELIRNHIIYYKKQIEDLCSKYNLPVPKEYYTELPPEVPINYMARADEIRANARKTLERFEKDRNLKYVKKAANLLNGKTQQQFSVNTVINYAKNLKRAIAEDNLVDMRRYEKAENWLDTIKSTAENIKNYLTQQENPAYKKGQVSLFELFEEELRNDSLSDAAYKTSNEKEEKIYMDSEHKLSDMVLDNMPDDITIKARNEYGYISDELLPISKEKALSFFDDDLFTIYRLYEDNTEGEVDNRDEIENFGGMFGIETVDWEKYLNNLAERNNKPKVLMAENAEAVSTKLKKEDSDMTKNETLKNNDERPSETTAFGNTPYRYVPNKTYVIIMAENAEAVSAKLKEAKIRHSGQITENGEAKITYDGSKQAEVDAILSLTEENNKQEQIFSVPENDLKAILFQSVNNEYEKTVAVGQSDVSEIESKAQRDIFKALYDIIIAAGLEDEYQAWKEQNAKEAEVKEEQKEQAKDNKPKTKAEIFGNTPYYKIENKGYLKVASDVTKTLMANLDAAGISYSGKINDNGTATLTFNKDDQKAIYATLNSAKKEQSQENASKAKPEIFGNTPYYKIEDKRYIKIPDKSIEAVIDKLNAENISYSGKINDNGTATLTFNNDDLDNIKTAVAAAEKENKLSAFAREVVEEKHDEKDSPDEKSATAEAPDINHTTNKNRNEPSL